MGITYPSGQIRDVYHNIIIIITSFGWLKRLILLILGSFCWFRRCSSSGGEEGKPIEFFDLVDVGQRVSLIFLVYLYVSW